MKPLPGSEAVSELWLGYEGGEGKKEDARGTKVGKCEVEEGASECEGG